MNPSQPSTDRIPELDGIRGVACLMVLALHYAVGIAITEPGTASHAVQMTLKPFLVGGVDLFFVLSGFLISGILMDHKECEHYFRTFWIRRVARIFPVYYLLLASYLLAVALRPDGAMPWADQWLLRAPLPVAGYATFTQNFFMAGHNDIGSYWLGITWSLAVEEQFYLVLPFVVAFSSRVMLIRIAVVCVVAATVIRLALQEGMGWWAAYTLLPARMESLFFGVLVACIVRSPAAMARARPLARWLDLLAVTLLVVILIRLPATWASEVAEVSPVLKRFFGWLPYTLRGFVFALGILRVFLVREGWYNRLLRNRILVGMGLISYGVYMFHQAVSGTLHGLILGQAPRFASLTDVGVAGVSFLVTLAIALTSFFLMELPIRRLGHRAKYGPKRVPERAASCPVPGEFGELQAERLPP